VFPSSLVESLLSAADPAARPIVQSYYLGVVDGKVTPFAYRRKDGWYESFEPAPGRVTRVDAVAAGATLVHRSVYEELQTMHAASAPYTWYAEEGADGYDLTEDIVFSRRAEERGYPMYVDARLLLGHLKERVLGYE
jgi:hypothetical protein